MDKFKFLPKSKINELPKTSGVYCFTEKKAEDGLPLLYIGKAINIKNRVKNHFNGKSPWELALLRQGFAGRVGFIQTNSEIEALILEANLIKKYQPKYNVMWRDDKNYFYVAVENNSQKIPYIYITHQPQNLKFKIKNLKFIYIGPFTEGTALKKTLRFLRRAFPYYSVKNHPKIKCTYCHLDLCPGPNPDLKNYKKNIKNLIAVLKGKKNSVLKNLRKEMKSASKENNFEDAAKTRDRIFALQQIMQHKHVINNKNNETQVVAILPNGKNTTTLLQNLLKIKNPINRIESYDISNIQGKMATGSMVVFINGLPDKNEYRKFKIRIQEKPNDIAMLKEVLQRRFLHKEWKFPDAILIDGGKAQLNIAVSAIPNLTRNTDSPVVRTTGLDSRFRGNDIKVMALAKGRQELFMEGKKNPIPLKSLPQEIYNLIKHLDDEAHRFAITYHKTLRKKNLLK